MKVNFNVTVEVERDAWRRSAGVDDVRSDVRNYLERLINESDARQRGLITNVIPPRYP